MSILKNLGQWASENTRTAGMIGLAVVLVAVLGYIYRPRAHDMTIFHRYRSDWNTVIFNFDREYMFTSIQVVTVDGDGKAGDIVWELEPGIPEGREPEREEAEARDTLVYGRRIKGMVKSSEGRPPPLEPGEPYRLVVKARGSAAEYDFTIEPRRQRGRDRG